MPYRAALGLPGRCLCLQEEAGCSASTATASTSRVSLLNGEGTGPGRGPDGQDSWLAFLSHVLGCCLHLLLVLFQLTAGMPCSL